MNCVPKESNGVTNAGIMKQAFHKIGMSVLYAINHHEVIPEIGKSVLDGMNLNKVVPKKCF